MEHGSRIGGVRLVWADLPTHCKVTMGIGGVPLWNVFSTEIVESVFTLAAEFMLPDGTVVVACRVEHLFRDTRGTGASFLASLYLFSAYACLDICR